MDRRLNEPRACARKLVAHLLVFLSNPLIESRIVMDTAHRLLLLHDPNAKYPSEKWWRGFRARNDEIIAKRVPQRLIRVRSNQTIKGATLEFFDNLYKLMANHRFTAEDIFNLDEVGRQVRISPVDTNMYKSMVPACLVQPGVTLSKKPKVVLAEKGAKTVYVPSEDLSTHTTMLVCVNANGDRLPPLYIFQGKFTNNELLDGKETSMRALYFDFGSLVQERLRVPWLLRLRTAGSTWISSRPGLRKSSCQGSLETGRSCSSLTGIRLTLAHGSCGLPRSVTWRFFACRHTQRISCNRSMSGYSGPFNVRSASVSRTSTG